jgi:hypothetical protein
MTRMKRQIPALLLLFTACTAASAFAQTSVAGDWEITITSPMGTRTTPISLKQDGEKLTGSFKSQAGELPVEGSISGSDVKLTFTINFQGQSLPITMTGTSDGSSITGKTDFGGFAEGEFSARRPAAAATAPAATGADSGAPTSTTSAMSGPAGTWDVTVKTPAGDIPITAALTHEAGRITGTVSTHLGELPVEGTMDGTTLTLSMVAKTPQGDIPITMTGELDGDSIVNGKASFGGMGQGEWTARRKP